tara:strand:+ start:398 stop:1087 length:690 start_codon:yes stop_codon:yes gene_type:complete
MDLVVCGAVIKDHNMIKKAIASAPDYPFSKKFILFDGFNKCKLIGDQYNAYKKLISESFPDFKVIEFNENIYFRNMIEKIADISTQERLFIIQDDVISPTMDLKQIESQMNIIQDCKILCFPHKYIEPCGTGWFEPFDDTYPLPFIKSHGFTERIFICNRLNILELCRSKPKNNKNNKRFIEFIYNTAMMSQRWETSTDEEKERYWEDFGCYFHHDLYHIHQVGKRFIL